MRALNARLKDRSISTLTAARSRCSVRSWTSVRLCAVSPQMMLLLLSTLAVPTVSAQDAPPPTAAPAALVVPSDEPPNAQSVAPGINSNFLDPNLEFRKGA